VLRSENGGQSWTDITGGLPHAPVNDIVRVRGLLYVATDVGVFSSPAARPRRSPVGTGMPRLVVTDLPHVPTNGRMYASTFEMGCGHSTCRGDARLPRAPGSTAASGRSLTPRLVRCG